MPGYKTHTAVGVTTAAGFLVLAYTEGLLSGLPPTRLAVFFAAAAAFAVFGSLFADVDVHSSKMRQFLGRLGTLAAIVVAGIAVVARPGLIVDPVAAALPGRMGPFVVGVAVIVAAGAVAKVVGRVFDDLTTHRGLFHSPVVPLLLAGAAGALLYVLGFHQPEVLATGGGVAGAAGFSHVLADAVA